MRSALLALTALAACALPLPMDDAPASLAAAETAFAAHSVREDMRAAFIAAFAEDGVFVREGWKAAKAFLEPRPAPPIVLDWRPQYVEVSASGELGLSTGPWRLTSKDKPAAAPLHGQFVSIWRREGGGPWKVEVDLGVSHPTPALWDAALESRKVAAAAGFPQEDLDAAERDFQRIAASRGARAAYEARAASNLRLYRPGIVPTTPGTASLEAAKPDGRLAWNVERLEVSRARDFGYVRGSYAEAGQPRAVLGYFLRVWRRETPGWRIVLDVVNPAPKN